MLSFPGGFRLTYHQAFAFASLELFAAPGRHTAFDPEVFRLVGQPDIGLVARPGFCGEVAIEVTRPGAWLGGSVDSLATAQAALAAGRSAGRNVTQLYPSVNHSDQDIAGWDLGAFPDDVPFANDVAGQLDDNFAVQVTGQLDVPADGTYQIGFNSDQGASLRILGRPWKTVVSDATGSAIIVDDALINDTLTFSSFTAGEIELTAGCYVFEVVMYEYLGGAFLELFGRGVSDRGIPDPVWHLLRADGAKAPASVQGLQLVSE